MPFADTQWHPADIHGKRYKDVPAEIADAASEAHKCMAVGARRASMLLARAVVDATAKDKGIAGRDLMKKIDATYDKRLIREDVRDGAHEIRFLGNDMAHGDFVEPVNGQDAALVLTLMDEVLEEVFHGPASVKRMRKAREAKKAAPPAVQSD